MCSFSAFEKRKARCYSKGMNKKAVLLAVVLLVALAAGGYFYLTKTKKGTSGLKVTSNPSASVFLNDQLLGKTPYESKYAAGDYTVKIIPDETGSGLTSWQGQVKLTPSFLTYISRDLGTSELLSGGEIVTLEKISGSEAQIAVFATPDTATVSLDGQEKGVTPSSLRDVLPGEHDVAVSAVGFIGRTVRVQATSGYKVVIAFQMALTKEQDASASAQPMTDAAPGTSVSDSASPSHAGALTPPYVKIKDTPTGFLRVRSSASTAAAEVAQIKPGETYPFLSEQEGWYKIAYEQGKEGWISGRYADKIDK